MNVLKILSFSFHFCCLYMASSRSVVVNAVIIFHHGCQYNVDCKKRDREEFMRIIGEKKHERCTIKMWCEYLNNRAIWWWRNIALREGGWRHTFLLCWRRWQSVVAITVFFSFHNIYLIDSHFYQWYASRAKLEKKIFVSLDFHIHSFNFNITFIEHKEMKFIWFCDKLFSFPSRISPEYCAGKGWKFSKLEKVKQKFKSQKKFRKCLIN